MTRNRAHPISTCPYHHFASMHEVLQPYEQQSEQTWLTGLGLELMTRHADESMSKQDIIRSLPMRDVAKVIRQQALKRCRKRMKKDKENVRAKRYPFNVTSGSGIMDAFCPQGANVRHRCFVNYKHFDDQISDDDLPWLWKALVSGALAPDLRMVLLERPFWERW